VFRELARVVAPGGRVSISDIVAENRLSPSERAERGSYCGCIAGALSKEEYEQLLREAGFDEVSVELRQSVADGMHSADNRGVKAAPGSRHAPAARAGAAGCACC